MNLVKGILNGDDWSILNESLVHFAKLLGRDPVSWVGVGVLEVQVVLAVLVELGGSNVHADLDLTGVAGLLNGITAQSNGFLKISHEDSST